MKTFLRYASWVMTAFATLTLLLIFAPQITTDGGGELNGLDVVFGCEIYGEQCLKFSFMNLLTYLLVILSGGFAVLNALKNDRKFLLVAIICAFIAALFFFLTTSLAVPVETLKELFNNHSNIGVGAILSALSLIAAGAIGIIKLTAKK